MGSGNEWGPGNELGGPESYIVPPPWKLYFKTCVKVPGHAADCPKH